MHKEWCICISHSGNEAVRCCMEWVTGWVFIYICKMMHLHQSLIVKLSADAWDGGYGVGGVFTYMWGDALASVTEVVKPSDDAWGE